MSRARHANALRAVPSRGDVRPLPRRAPGRPRRGEQRAPRRTGLLAVFVAVVLTLGVVLALTAFGPAGSAVPGTLPAPAKRLNPAGPPTPQVVAMYGAVRLQQPIAQERVTAIGYHASAGGAVALEPVGRQANEGIFSRLVRRLVGSGRERMHYYKLGGEGGPGTAVLNVGAPSGTDVYAPVDGTIVGLTDYIVSGKRRGTRIDIRPSDAASVVVSLIHLRPDPALAVGGSVAAARSRIGTVLDFSKIERQALARYTQDSGNHVALEVHPAASLTLP